MFAALCFFIIDEKLRAAAKTGNKKPLTNSLSKIKLKTVKRSPFYFFPSTFPFTRASKPFSEQ
jgi:hypothetical protein